MTTTTTVKLLCTTAMFMAFAAVAPAHAQTPTKVTLVQSHQNIGVGEEVFLYAVPKRLGYFKAENLEVVSQTARNGVQVGQMIETKSAEFGTAGTDTLLLSEEQGGKLLAFYHLKNHNGSMIATMAGSSIKSFADMKGRTIGVSSVGYGGHMFLKYELDRLGIAADQYKVVATGAGPAAAAALRNGTVEALSLWDAMFATMEAGGMKLDYIQYPLMDRIAGLNLVTSREIIETRPALATGMCRAVAKGLEFTLENPDAALRIFYEEFPTTKPAGVSAEDQIKTDKPILLAWLKYAQMGTPRGADTGGFVPDRFTAYRDYLKEQNVLKANVDPSKVYTDAFLKSCNAFDRAAVVTEARNFR